MFHPRGAYGDQISRGPAGILGLEEDIREELKKLNKGFG